MFSGLLRLGGAAGGRLDSAQAGLCSGWTLLRLGGAVQRAENSAGRRLQHHTPSQLLQERNTHRMRDERPTEVCSAASLTWRATMDADEMAGPLHRVDLSSGSRICQVPQRD